MKTQIMKLSEIKPAPYNPRKTLVPGDKEFEALKNSLTRFGLAEPLIVNETTGLLVSGHQRLNVLKVTGAKEAEVVLVELDPEQEKLLNIALNKIDGDWDYGKLEALFKEISAEDIAFTGFDEEEISSLFGTVSSPTFEDNNEEEEEAEEKPEKEKAEKPEPQFNIFLSFPSKEVAEEWLKQQGLDEEFGGGRNITFKMEGTEYGKRC